MGSRAVRIIDLAVESVSGRTTPHYSCIVAATQALQFAPAAIILDR
jgi:hypothetical protein